MKGEKFNFILLNMDDYYRNLGGQIVYIIFGAILTLFLAWQAIKGFMAMAKGNPKKKD